MQALIVPSHSPTLAAVAPLRSIVQPRARSDASHVGSSVDDLCSLAVGATVADPLILQRDQERDNLDALEPWPAEAVASLPIRQQDRPRTD